jgi:hypothetical protein
MRTLLVTLLLLLVVGGGMAADKPAEQVPDKQPEAAGKQQDPAARKTAEKKATVQWPRPYKPTEEVSADSMVPFPTDI